ncbi:MAG TPA: hypothetical protein RMH99_20505 [Sandaracinaceae bacterium LLY-WYZ-13_1]|nr:hypothetical protein [Sandaracinaceae bacterium LLY-WYZ-13_1]
MRAPLLACLSLLLAAPAAAQPAFRAPVVGDSQARVTATAHDTVATALPGGDTLAAVHFDADVLVAGRRVRSLDTGRTVALVRLDRHGRARWIRRFAEEAGRGRPHLRGIERIEALPDGGAIVGGTFGDGGLDQGVLARVGPDGRTVWRLAPRRATDYSRFVPALSRRGTVVLLGRFFRGHFQLPGAPAWRTRRRFSTFLAEVDLSDGAVRWARRIGGEGRHLEVAPDGTLVVAGQFQRALRVGRSTLRATGGERGAFAARFDPDGEPLDAVGYATEAEDDAHGVVPLTGGGLAMLVSSGAGRPARYAILGFDEAGERTFARSLGSRAALVRSPGARTLLLAVPSRPRRAALRGTPYEVVDHVDLVRLSASGAEIGRRPVRFGAGAPLLRSLHAEATAGRVVLSGALLHRARSESFFAWSSPPPAPSAVAARVGSVL